ncbi:MAG: tetratricopeptide repeat protein [Myxococcota bacterium]|jgi:tetratricopeptide (TPR) repeat protein|nr:tetratricopeptide repeat protein [Myxococcota bacterium]
MSIRIVRGFLAGLLIALTVAPLFAPVEAVAQQRERKKSGSWARQNEIDKLTAKRLQKATELLADEEYAEAHAALDRLRIRSLNDLEKNKLYKLRGYIYFNQEKLPEARKYLELALATKSATVDDHELLRFQIGQISMQESNWEAAVENFNKWFEIAGQPNANSYYMLALAYWQLKDFENAVVPARQAVELTSEPQERWMQLLLAIHLTAKNYEKAIHVYDMLVRRYPKKSYWMQLATLHGALGNYNESLIPLQLAHTQGMLTEDAEVRRLAELLLFLELPIRAVDVLRDGLDRNVIEEDSKLYELLSNGLIMAREYDDAVEPLTKAAELDESGRIYLRLAEVHIQRERWDEAAAALQLAIDKGNLPNPGQAELLMGISYYSRKRPDDAVSWFVKAKRFDATEAEATTWLNHIARETGSNADT